MAPSPQVQNGDPHRTTLTIANLNRPADKKKKDVPFVAGSPGFGLPSGELT